MISSVSQVLAPTAVASAQPANDTQVQPVQAPAAPAATGQAAEPAKTNAPDPLELSVERGQDGIYVYSLKDPSTGRLVAVIPREHADSAPQSNDYQAGGYVQLKA